MNYITMTHLTLTEGLGSQMYHIASLVSIAKRSGHSIVFFDDNNSIGKGLLVNNIIFPNVPILTPSIQEIGADNLTVLVYPIRKDVLIDSNFFDLNPEHNYNITGLFHSYKMWMPIIDYIKYIYTPNVSVIDEANKVISTYRASGKKLVSIHVRRGDYLHAKNAFFTQLSIDYYMAAISRFEDLECDFLVFSDDMEWCKENFCLKENIFFMDGGAPLIDLFSMSLCDHNIISNSSFGMWSAILNKNNERRVICPAKYCRNDLSVPFFNYGWYPDDFTPILDGNC